MSSVADSHRSLRIGLSIMHIAVAHTSERMSKVDQTGERRTEMQLQS